MFVLKFNEYNNNEFDLLKESKEKANLENWRRHLNQVVKKFNINMSFVTSYGTAITSFFPIVEHFVTNLDLNVEANEEQIVCLTICALAILFDEKKDDYRNLFEPIRLGGLYSLISSDPSVKTQNMNTERKTPLINLFEFIRELFKFFASKMDVIVKDIKAMLDYNDLFVPFIISLTSVLSNHNLSPLEGLTKDGMNKALSVGFSLGSLSYEQLLKQTWEGIKKMKPVGEHKKVIEFFRNMKWDLESDIEPINGGDVESDDIEPINDNIMRFKDFIKESKLNDKTQTNVDRLLDKILKYGKSSLTNDEREYLDRVSTEDIDKDEEKEQFIESSEGMKFKETERKRYTEDGETLVRIDGILTYNNLDYEGHFIATDSHEKYGGMTLLHADFESVLETTIFDADRPDDIWDQLEEIVVQMI